MNIRALLCEAVKINGADACVLEKFLSVYVMLFQRGEADYTLKGNLKTLQSSLNNIAQLLTSGDRMATLQLKEGEATSTVYGMVSLEITIKPTSLIDNWKLLTLATTIIFIF